MLCRQGMTLMEIIVVMVMIAVAAVFTFPNFTVPTEHARAVTVQNNLLAIYSAQQNYSNNNGNVFCTTGVTPAPEPTCAETGTSTCAPDIASINCNLSLNIQDDGTYIYSCAGTTCTATRVSNNQTIVLTLNQPIKLTGGGLNPACNLTASWCP